jgi:hypothetical protein
VKVLVARKDEQDEEHLHLLKVLVARKDEQDEEHLHLLKVLVARKDEQDECTHSASFPHYSMGFVAAGTGK